MPPTLFIAAMEIYKSFTFEAAHYLPHVSAKHKCRNLHGHSYRLQVFVSGDIQAHSGWVIDFNEVKAAVKPVVERLDHQLLNEIAGLENPTVENVAVWIWNQIKPRLPLLCKVELAETATSGCVYCG